MRAVRFIALLLVVVLMEGRALAQFAAPPELRSHLAAGEFGPAREVAERLDAPQRDAALAHIARAQAAGGAWQGAVASLSELGNDRLRAQTMDSIAAHPWRGAAGGAAMADFTTLIELLTSTVSPNDWLENGGVGTVEEFPTGVYVDAAGVLRKLESDATTLQGLTRRFVPAEGNRDVRRTAQLRKVSLNRLEREIQLAWLEGRQPDETMRNLAGMYRIEYLVVLPETGDLLLCGPAGDWQTHVEGHIVNIESQQPVLQLEDLVVLMRQAQAQATAQSQSNSGVFGCAIKPRQENLQATQQFLSASSAKPLRPGQRGQWLEQLQQHLGRQDVEVFGVDPRTRVAKILVEADYRMKMLGIGRDEPVLGVTSYLDLIAAEPDRAAELQVLRWWFAMDYDAVRTDANRHTFQIVGQGVKLLSENEFLTSRGERVHTGKSEEKNKAFADSFTKHFPALAQKYPIYAQLRNVFDLALVTTLIEQERLADRIDWHRTHFNDPERFHVSLGHAPREVDSVINHRSVGRGRFIATVAGGVRADPRAWVAAEKLADDQRGDVATTRRYAPAPESLPQRSWWWD